MKKIIVILAMTFFSLTSSAATIKSGRVLPGFVELEIEYRGTAAAQHSFTIDSGQCLKVLPPIYDDAKLIEDPMGDGGIEIIQKTITIDTSEFGHGARVFLHGDSDSIFKFTVSLY